MCYRFAILILAILLLLFPTPVSDGTAGGGNVPHQGSAADPLQGGKAAAPD